MYVAGVSWLIGTLIIAAAFGHPDPPARASSMATVECAILHVVTLLHNAIPYSVYNFVIWK